MAVQIDSLAASSGASCGCRGFKSEAALGIPAFGAVKVTAAYLVIAISFVGRPRPPASVEQELLHVCLHSRAGR